MKHLSLLMLSILSCGVVQAVTDTREFPAEGIRKVKIEVPSGLVSILASSEKTATVAIKKDGFAESCKLEIKQSKGQLKVQVGKPLMARCEAEYELKIPKDVSVDVKMGSGKLNLTGTQGDLSFDLGSGEIKAAGQFREVEGEIGSGPVEIEGLRGSGEIEAGNGKIQITFAEQQPKGRLKIKTGSGDTLLRFAKTSKITASLSTGVGELNNELGETPQASYQIQMKAGSGSLKIQAY